MYPIDSTRCLISYCLGYDFSYAQGRQLTESSNDEGDHEPDLSSQKLVAVECGGCEEKDDEYHCSYHSWVIVIKLKV